MEVKKCPVCEGRGKTFFNPDTSANGEICHACSGRGYLVFGQQPYEPDERYPYYTTTYTQLVTPLIGGIVNAQEVRRRAQTAGKKEKCFICEGRGMVRDVNDRYWTDCTYCDGKGYYQKLRKPTPNEYWEFLGK